MDKEIEEEMSNGPIFPALEESLTILTADAAIPKYNIPVIC